MAIDNTHPHLVGFWPFHEPSGSPIFQNLADRFVHHPSGLALDFMPVLCGDSDNAESYWPGTVNFLQPASGLIIKGIQPIGDGTSSVTSTNTTMYGLTPGQYCQAVKDILNSPQLVGSGFTLGGWIYTNADAYESSVNTNAMAFKYALINKSQGGTTTTQNNNGFSIGVSGLMEYGTQNPAPGDPFEQQLALYASVGPGGANFREVKSPVESGNWVHFAFVYQYVDGTNNIIRLYKNDHLEDSDTTNLELDRGDATYYENPLFLGCTEGTLSTDLRIPYISTGPGHIVSGLYYFDIPLDTPTIQEIYYGGGIYWDKLGGRTPLEAKRISVLNESLLANFKINGKGFCDSSLHRQHAISAEDGTNSTIKIVGGPHQAYAAERELAAIPIVCTSGITEKLKNSSWSIGGWFMNQLSNSANNLFWAIGANNTTGDYTRQGHYAKLEWDTTNRLPQFTVAHAGDPTISTSITPSGYEQFPYRAWSHILCMYNHDSNNPGISMYLNGHLSTSGYLEGQLWDGAISASGYPLIFLGGNSTDPNTFDGTKGDDCSAADMVVFNRLLTDEEIRGLSLSGVNTEDYTITNLDPRLKAYWRCNEASGAPLVFDYSTYGGSGIKQSAPKAHLVPYLNTIVFDDVFDDGTVSLKQHRDIDYLSSRIDQFGAGITSGIWVPMGGSEGGDTTYSSSSQSFSRRFRVDDEDSDVRAPHFGHDLALYFKITPGPRSTIAESFDSDVNYATLFSHGIKTSEGTWRVFLTPLNLENNLYLVFGSNTTSSNFRHLASGIVTPGTEHDILIRTKTLHQVRAVSDPVAVQFWLDGSLVDNNIYTYGDIKFVSDIAGTENRLGIGALELKTAVAIDSSRDEGLGFNKLREIAFFNGTITDQEAFTLANNGISTVSQYEPENITQFRRIKHNDPDLEGYWRFSNYANPSNSGLDLGVKGNDLTNLLVRDGDPPDQGARTMMAFQGPFKGYSLYPVQCSGIGFSHNSIFPTISPFAVSGSAFNSPDNGFSVGLRVITNKVRTTNEPIMVYGVYPRSNQNIPQDLGWAVAIDSDEAIKFILSEDGAISTSVTTINATTSGAAIVGLSTKRYGATAPAAPPARYGYCEPSQPQGFNHYAFSYNSTLSKITAYFNGEPIDEKDVDHVHVPALPENRMITFFNPLSSLWTFSTTKFPHDLAITDVFYMSRALSTEEVRYIATSGIGLATPVTTSGIVGGYLDALGVDYASGVVGGYIHPLVYTSGIVGGFTEGTPATTSGIVGGYIHPLAYASGIFGGYIEARGVASGIVGGYSQGLAYTSGICGGFINGGASGILNFDAFYTVLYLNAEDFDALLEIQRRTFYEFDAKLQTYQVELAPSSTIITPDATVTTTAPFTQYFVGSGTPYQGKTITQATWDYGDLTSQQLGIPSGTDVYVRTHSFTKTGLFRTIFKVFDSDGLVGSDSVSINTTDGADLPDVEMTATPQDGNAPLRVQFTTSVTNVPAGVTIKTSYVDFGDGQHTLRNNPSHVYSEPGVYTPRLVVLDSRGFLTTDTLLIGVNT